MIPGRGMEGRIESGERRLDGAESSPIVMVIEPRITYRVLWSYGATITLAAILGRFTCKRSRYPSRLSSPFPASEKSLRRLE